MASSTSKQSIKESKTEPEAKSTLNIMCSICYEFYKEFDKVYSTYPCGHLFHRDCLFRWLKQQSSCPQCCRRCQRQRAHPVYLNYGDGVVGGLDHGEVDEAPESKAKNSTPQWMFLGDWMLDDENFELPQGAIKAGTDGDGNDAYIARAHFARNNLVPASFVPAKRGAYLPFACREHFVRDDVEILIYEGEYEWVADSSGNVPLNALSGGYAETREPYYVGRGIHNGLTLPGKVHGSHRVLYMPYKGEEVNNEQYEVLVIKNTTPSSTDRPSTTTLATQNSSSDSDD